MLRRPALVSQEQVSLAQPRGALSAATAKVGQPLVVGLYLEKERERENDRRGMNFPVTSKWLSSEHVLLGGRKLEKQGVIELSVHLE